MPPLMGLTEFLEKRKAAKLLASAAAPCGPLERSLAAPSPADSAAPSAGPPLPSPLGSITARVHCFGKQNASLEEGSAVKALTALLFPTGGAATSDPLRAKTRTDGNGGIAKKTGELIDQIIAAVNVARK
jgi:hypothetical protein